MKIIKLILLAFFLVIVVSSTAFSQNKALGFDGVDDMITVPSTNSLSLQSFTIEAWVHPGTIVSKWLPLITKEKTRDTRNYGLYISPNSLIPHFSFKDVNNKRGSYASLNSKKTLIQHIWNHVCITFSGSKSGELKIYLNGVLTGDQKFIAYYPNLSDFPVRIGNGIANHGAFKGGMDEIRILNRALSIDDVNQNMRKELIGNESGLVLYYNFDKISPGGVVKDLSPKGNDGMITGNATFFESAPRIKMLPKGSPKLHVEVHYQDSDGNGILENSKTGQIIVSVTNENDVTIKKIDISIKCLTTDQGDGFITYKSMDIVDNSPNYIETFEIKNIESPKSDSLRFEITIECTANNSTYGSVDPYVFIVPTGKSYVMPKRPADLYIENLLFKEPSGNMALDGYESGSIEFTLWNKGLGKAQNINISLSPLISDKNLFYSKEKIVEVIESKSSYSVSIPISAGGTVETLRRSIRIQANEEFGFDADPIILNFETVAFNPPDLRIEKIAINDREEGDAYGNGNSIIEPNESIVVSAYVQNFGSGAAEDVNATIMLASSNRNISCPDQGKEIALGNILPGEYKPVEFYFFTSKRYAESDIPLKIKITEAKGDYGKEINLGLKMNIRTENIIDVNIAKIDIPKAEIKEIEGFSKSDIDEVTVKSKITRSSSLAVIIGIEKYKYASSASYASRDAGAFYQYATKILGIPDANVYYLVDDGATVGEFSKLFDEDGWLSRRVTENSDIFVFYSGHGAPDIKTKVPYVIPYDIDPNYAQNGYSSYQLYKNLGALNAKSVTVMLDACFSGQNKENEMLLVGARPALLEIAQSAVPSNVTLISASSANQISSGYPTEKHGIFSYFLMKGMSVESDTNKDGKITLGELYDYLYSNVKSTAGQLDREQTPELVNGNRDQVICEF